MFYAVPRAFTLSGKLRPEEVVQATLSSLPDEVVDTVGITSLPSEDSVAERKRKLEYLEMQEELIKVYHIFLLLFNQIIMVCNCSITYLFIISFICVGRGRERERSISQEKRIHWW